jgi:hypothetical protein
MNLRPVLAFLALGGFVSRREGQAMNELMMGAIIVGAVAGAIAPD